MIGFAFVSGAVVGIGIGIVLCLVAGWRTQKADPVKTVNNGAGLPPSFHGVAFAIKEAFDKMGGPNYLCIETEYGREPFLLTIQRRNGETPYEQLKALRNAVASGLLEQRPVDPKDGGGADGR